MIKQSAAEGPRRLRMGMVGGGRGSLIGATHVRAAGLDGGMVLVAGALSSTAERARQSARDFHIDAERTYDSWQAMLEREQALPPEERLDLVSVVTPNHLHFAVASAFVAAGFHVLVDKPMVHSSEEARRLAADVEAGGNILAVSYNYTGYPMVKQARHMVREGRLDEVVALRAEHMLANPGRVKARLVWIEGLIMAGRFEEAERAVTDLSGILDLHPEAAVQRAWREARPGVAPGRNQPRRFRSRWRC